MPTINFKGKAFVQNHHLTVKYHQLVPNKEASLTDNISLNDNLIIHGDNLLALKALLPNYAGKIDCIFIDPPYNTGEEKWVYNDNVNSPMIQEWLGKVVDKDDLTRHDKWCCMMMPRLKLLRELLHKDGAIFITIDDNEVHHLRMLMDEIFGEQNFVTNIVWQARKSVQNDTDISQQHNHILVYAKNRRQEERRLKESNAHIWYTMDGFAFKPLELDRSKFSNPDNDPRGPWKADPFDAPQIRENLTYPIVNPNTGVEYLPPNGRHWRTEEDKYKALLKDGRIIFGTTGRAKPQLKVFWEEKKDFGEVERTWWGNGSVETFLYDEETEEEILNVDQESAEEWTNYGTATSASKMLQQIFETKEKVFDTPKPVELVKHILKLATKDDAIILDSFAGSGTTGHAVLEMNYEDEKSNRKFILIESEDYANTITAERIRRVIRGVPSASNEKIKNGIGGTFSYFELGDAIELEDILKGENLPEYKELARYLFYTATGNDFDISKVDEKKNFIGENDQYEVYLFYKPDIQYLKTTALDLDLAKSLGEYKGKKRLVFAPMKYLDNEYLLQYRIEYCQLPFEIYRFKE